jgi:hypothetical protein
MMARLACAAVAASVVLGSAHGFATSLGLDVSGLGAGSKVVAACGNGLMFGYRTAFDPGASNSAVDGIELSDIPTPCLGKSVSVTFLDGADNAIGSPVHATLSPSGTTESIPIDPSSNPVEAARVCRVSVVVS